MYSVKCARQTEIDLLHLPKCFSLNSGNISLQSKGSNLAQSATSCVRGQDATKAPARQMSETESLNSAQFMLQCFISFPEFNEFLFYLGNTPIEHIPPIGTKIQEEAIVLTCNLAD